METSKEEDRHSTRGRQAVYQIKKCNLPEEERRVYQRDTGLVLGEEKGVYQRKIEEEGNESTRDSLSEENKLFARGRKRSLP